MNNLSGETIYTLTSDNEKRIQGIAQAINDGIIAPTGTSASGPSTQSSNSAKSNAEILSELKNMLDSGLITQEEFDKKKAEILSKM